MLKEYDVIVVGAGHAGCEAAAAAANMGSKTLLITIDMTKFGHMSCNPAMGGIAKGQIIREIDAMGGYSGLVTDRSMIQFRMLNRSKGPAMWSPRAQCDRTKFTIEWRKMLEQTPNLYFWQDAVQQVIIENGKAIGVVTKLGLSFYAKAVVLTTGTFQNGLMHVGRVTVKGGRSSEPAVYGLSDQLREHGFEVGRMKTGTPARLDARSINFNLLQEQSTDDKDGMFSFLNDPQRSLIRKSCWITYTNPEVHRTLEKGFKDSPLYTGIIKGVGPRYCPSIEDKIVTFHEKENHQLFLEPEGENTIEYYINGFSSSLPWDVQFEALRLIKGLENVHLFRPGYAIEYDYYPPTQLQHSLETKNVANLFFAGQINGTTGYEEAAAQGLMAGINAHLRINNREAMVLARDEAYIGVLIDDLVTKGVDEPYRMFTSRAEYRILLRQDNADERLTEKSFNVGLATPERLAILKQKQKNIESVISFVSTHNIKPDTINPTLEEKQTSPLKQTSKLRDLILRPQLNITDLIPVSASFKKFIETISSSDEVLESVDIMLKYEGYIDRERQLADKAKRLDTIRISDTFDYTQLHSISTEARQKLTRIKPKTIGQAARIPGVSPSDINILLVHFGR